MVHDIALDASRRAHAKKAEQVMDMMERATALVGGAMVAIRRFGAPDTQAVGTTPIIPEARKQGIMTLKMPTARGWAPGQVPRRRRA
jgi:hypothetical protein